LSERAKIALFLGDEALLNYDRTSRGDRFHRFCVKVMLVARPTDDEEMLLRTVKAFYRYVDQYPEYAKKLRHHPGTVNESRYPDYDYACRMTGLYPDYIRNLERQYTVAQDLPQSELSYPHLATRYTRKIQWYNQAIAELLEV